MIITTNTPTHMWCQTPEQKKPRSAEFCLNPSDSQKTLIQCNNNSYLISILFHLFICFCCCQQELLSNEQLGLTSQCLVVDLSNLEGGNVIVENVFSLHCSMQYRSQLIWEVNKSCFAVATDGDFCGMGKQMYNEKLQIEL